MSRHRLAKHATEPTWHVGAAILVVAAASVALTSGCDAYLQRRAGRSAPSDTALGPSSSLTAGLHTANGECTTLLMVEGDDPVSGSVRIALEVVIGEAGLPTHAGTELIPGTQTDIQLGSFTIQRTVTAVDAFPEMVVVNFDAGLAIDSDTPYAINLSGDGAETYTPQPDGGTTYALVVVLVGQPEDGSAHTTTMAYECQAELTE